MDKALITGSSGMIGKKINFGIKPSSKELDVTDFKSVALYIQNMIEKPFCIIHLASVNLRESEENKGKAIDPFTGKVIKDGKVGDVVFSKSGKYNAAAVEAGFNKAITGDFIVAQKTVLKNLKSIFKKDKS
mgnify:CR=1 FL=1